MLLSWQRKESSTCKRCLPSQGDILSFLPPPNCETSSASHLNNKGKCGNAVVTCNLFYVHSTVGSSHQRSKKKTPNQPTIGPDFKRANIHLPPAVCCSDGTFWKFRVFFFQVCKVQAELFWKSSTMYFTDVLFLIVLHVMQEKNSLKLWERQVRLGISHHLHQSNKNPQTTYYTDFPSPLTVTP